MSDSTRPVTGFHARTDAEKLANPAEAIADLHLATGAGWTDEGREGFVRAVCAILAAHVAVDRAALIDLLRDETGWNWGNGEQDEPEPIFGCDTRVPSSDQMLAEFADRILTEVYPASQLLPVLAEPGPAVPAHDAMAGWREDWGGDEHYPAAVPAHDIDRDALAAAWDDGNAVGLDGWVGPNRGTEPDGEAIRLRQQYLDKLALVRPVAGVILSPDEVALARSWYTRLPIGVSPDDVALAARLEASS